MNEDTNVKDTHVVEDSIVNVCLINTKVETIKWYKCGEITFYQNTRSTKSTPQQILLAEAIKPAKKQ
jgi:hypothetical protein